MPGMQSNSTPQQRPDQPPEQWSEQRDLSIPRSVALEAAKRSVEARKADPGSPIGSHSDTDGRPSWLRRWAGESRRDTEPRAAQEGQKSGRSPDGSPEDTASNLTEDSVIAKGTAAVAGPSNGHTGQSIEAAFDFETVFHFETDLEAEATDDWLDLSDEGPHLTAAEESKAVQGDDSADLERGSEHLPNTSGLLDLPRVDDRTPTSPDPKAVRAAILRLAQQSHGGQILKLQPGDTAEAGDASLASLTQEGGFAVVARRVWGGAGTDSPASPESARTGGCSPLGEASSSTPDGRYQVTDQPYGDQQANATLDRCTELQGKEANRADSVASEAIRATEVERADEALTEQQTAASHHKAASHQNKAQDGHTAVEGRDAIEKGQAALHARSSVHIGLSNPASSGPGYAAVVASRQDEDARAFSDSIKQAESRRGDAEASAQESRFIQGPTETQLPTGTSQQAVEEHGEAEGRASAGPALAHDAGNLLSALKLYSELLALSGVLHARHRHYAEDLKLLASRSEALIDRLLASYNLAERQAQRLLQESANRNVPAASVIATGFPLTHSGQDEPAPSVSRLTPLSTPPGARSETGPEVGIPPNPRFAEPVQQTLQSGAQVGLPPGARAQGLAAPDRQNFAFIGAHAPQDLREDEASGSAHSEADRPGPVSLVDLLTRWGSLLSMIARSSVQVKFGPQAALPIRVTEEALERILVNLVHNAMTATCGGGAIRIGVGRAETRRSPHNEVRARPGNRMVLTVDDSGCGMTEEQIAKALGRDPHPNGQAAPDAGNIDGSPVRGSAFPLTSIGLGTASEPEIHQTRGLGLQIVRELVAASGGELAIFSRRGVGTRIEIQWPTVELASGMERFPPASVGATAAGSRGNYAVGRGQRLAGTYNDDAAEPGQGASIAAYNGTTQQRLNVAVEGAVAC